MRRFTSAIINEDWFWAFHPLYKGALPSWARDTAEKKKTGIRRMTYFMMGLGVYFAQNTMKKVNRQQG
jgi:hypothetical protein